MLVSGNDFHVVSALQSIVFFFRLIRSLVDLTLAAFYRMRSLALYVTRLCIFIIVVFHLYVTGGKSVGEVLSVCDVNWRELFKWAVPGLLYFCDNLIGFYILLHLSAVS